MSTKLSVALLSCMHCISDLKKMMMKIKSKCLKAYEVFKTGPCPAVATLLLIFLPNATCNSVSCRGYKNGTSVTD